MNLYLNGLRSIGVTDTQIDRRTNVSIDIELKADAIPPFNSAPPSFPMAAIIIHLAKSYFHLHLFKFLNVESLNGETLFCALPPYLGASSQCG